MVQIHVPFPYATALFVATVEFACGAGPTLGLLTPDTASMASRRARVPEQCHWMNSSIAWASVAQGNVDTVELPTHIADMWVSIDAQDCRFSVI